MWKRFIRVISQFWNHRYYTQSSANFLPSCHVLAVLQRYCYQHTDTVGVINTKIASLFLIKSGGSQKRYSKMGAQLCSDNKMGRVNAADGPGEMSAWAGGVARDSSSVVVDGCVFEYHSRLQSA